MVETTRTYAVVAIYMHTYTVLSHHDYRNNLLSIVTVVSLAVSCIIREEWWQLRRAGKGGNGGVIWSLEITRFIRYQSVEKKCY